MSMAALWVVGVLSTVVPVWGVARHRRRRRLTRPTAWWGTRNLHP